MYECTNAEKLHVTRKFIQVKQYSWKSEILPNLNIKSVCATWRNEKFTYGRTGYGLFLLQFSLIRHQETIALLNAKAPGKCSY